MPWATGLELAWNCEVCSQPGKWNLCKLPKFFQIVSRGAYSLTDTLNFLVTDILALAPGLLTDSEVNRSHFSSLLLPHGASSVSLALSTIDFSVN